MAAKKSNEKKNEKPMFKAEGMKVANVRRLSDTVVAFPCWAPAWACTV